MVITQIQRLMMSLCLFMGPAFAWSQDQGSSSYEIHVSLADQNVTIYQNGKPIRKMICSTGKPETPTRPGDFRTTVKKDYIWYNDHSVGVYYATRTSGNQGIHSSVFDQFGDRIEKEFAKLGEPVTGGCVRVKFLDAKWIYENIPMGSRVVIK